MASVDAALTLLDLFDEARPGAGLSEIARLTGRDKATLHRHLSALAGAGLLEQDAGTRAYRLGPALPRLAAMRERTVDPALSLAPALHDLSREAGELAHLSRLDGLRLVTVAQAEAQLRPLRVRFDAGSFPPLLATSSGKAATAFAADPEPAIAGGRPAGMSEGRAREIVRRVRETGIASSENSVAEGVSSMAVPVFDGAGRASGAVSVAYPTARAAPEARARIEAALRRAAPHITRAAGGAAPEAVLALWRDTQRIAS